LTKDSVPEELKEAVRRVVVGGRYVSATLAEKLAVDLREELIDRSTNSYQTRIPGIANDRFGKPLSR